MQQYELTIPFFFFLFLNIRMYLLYEINNIFLLNNQTIYKREYEIYSS